MSNLNEQQFLYHGTAMDVEGGRILPASVHGKGSYWGDTGKTRGEPSKQHAWAIPSEETAWEYADDRANYDVLEKEHLPRSRVYAVHPNSQQSPGNDASNPGEIKAPHFDVAEQVDIKPGHQGTFPGINWNEHAVGRGTRLPGDEDANHPSNLSTQFGHRAGVLGYKGKEAVVNKVHQEALEEDTHRAVTRFNTFDRSAYERPPTLPGMSNERQFFTSRRFR